MPAGRERPPLPSPNRFLTPPAACRPAEQLRRRALHRHALTPAWPHLLLNRRSNLLRTIARVPSERSKSQKENCCLILPWAKVPGLVSYLLGQVAQVISEDWQRLYCHPVYLLETFIDPGRFGGICYRAANWQWLGLTTGRGKNDRTMRANRSLKELWVLPLTKDFRIKLQEGHG